MRAERADSGMALTRARACPAVQYLGGVLIAFLCTALVLFVVIGLLLLVVLVVFLGRRRGDGRAYGSAFACYVSPAWSHCAARA